MASVTRTPGGRWKARYRDPAGRSRSRTFDTKNEARRFLDAAGADMQRGHWVDPSLSRMRLDTWVETFLRTTPELGESTRATYERDLARYVLPRFGSMPLAAIRPGDVRVWISDELAAGIAPSSVHRHYRTLRRVLNLAVANELLAKSPCSSVKAPAVPRDEMRFLTADEVNELAMAINPRLRTFVYTAAYTGLRWGELIGLRRAAVDVPGARLVVVDQLVLVNNQWHRKAPKTAAGRRRVGLPAFLAALLDEQLECHALPCADGLVFPNRAGNR